MVFIPGNQIIATNKPETYGANNLLHVPDKSFNGKTIVEPPECEGYPTGYPPHYYIYDCKENNIPCTISRQIVVQIDK